MSIVEESLKDAKKNLRKGLPYWTDVFTRPLNSEFEKLLRQDGFHIFHICFWIEGEDVYSPISIEVDRLREVAKNRVGLRDSGVSKALWPVI